MSSFDSMSPEPQNRIAFLFPGQGGQHARVARDLYDRSPGYAEAFDECLEQFEAVALPLRRWWLQGGEVQLRSPRAALSLTFAVEYALAQAWRSWGITPAAVLGFSVGEMTAGAVAGTFTLEDAVRAVAIRSQAIQDLPPGGMLAVFASRDEVARLLSEDVWIAAIIDPRQLVVAGPIASLADAAVELARAGLVCRLVPTTHAAHGPGIAPAVPVFDRVLRQMRLAPPTIDFYSGSTGRQVSAEQATDPGFWSQQLSQPVLFAEALDTLTQAVDRLLMIEVGPGQALTKVVRRHPTVVDGRHRMFPTLAYRPVEPLAQTRAALDAIGKVAAEGHAVNWLAVERLLAMEPINLGHPVEQAQTREILESTAEDNFAAAPVRMRDAQQTAQSAQHGYNPDGPDPTGEASPASPDSTIDRLRRLWRSVLRLNEIADDADFFDLGGDSLTAVALLSQVQAEFDVVLEAPTLFDHTRLDALADQIDRMIS